MRLSVSSISFVVLFFLGLNSLWAGFEPGIYVERTQLMSRLAPTPHPDNLKYPSQYDFGPIDSNTTRRTEYVLQDGKYVPGKITDMPHQHLIPRFRDKILARSDCKEVTQLFLEDDLRLMYQMGTIETMYKAGYVTLEEIKRLVTMTKSLDPWQISFYYKGVTVQINESYFESTNKATLWMVSGQYRDMHGVLKQGELPWQKDIGPKRYVGEKLDRNKYRCVWEWGRVLSLETASFETILGISARDVQGELERHNCKLEDSYIFFHALDEARARLFKSRHPLTEFGTFNETEKVFMVPLNEMLEKYR